METKEGKMMRSGDFFMKFCLIQCALVCGVYAATTQVNVVDQSYQMSKKNARDRLLHFIEKGKHRKWAFD